MRILVILSLWQYSVLKLFALGIPLCSRFETPVCTVTEESWILLCASAFSVFKIRGFGWRIQGKSCLKAPRRTFRLSGFSSQHAVPGVIFSVFFLCGVCWASESFFFPTNYVKSLASYFVFCFGPIFSLLINSNYMCISPFDSVEYWRRSLRPC